MASLFDRLARRAAAPERVSRREIFRAERPESNVRSTRIDYTARMLATMPLSRRTALGVGGATLAWIAAQGAHPGRARADSCPPICTFAASGCHGPDGNFCTAPCDPSNGLPQSCPDPGGSHCCPSDNTCCSSLYYSDPCCAPGYVCCGGFLCCQPGQICCLSPTPADSAGLRGGACCAAGSQCDSQGRCKAPCPSLRQCGSTCCPSGQFCCDPDKGMCCETGATCCAAGVPGHQTNICCESPNKCASQILPGHSGITADSPQVCCPPEMLVTATTSPICCPPGSVHQPGGGLSTAGGVCCTAGNVCGNECCDSLPDFPKKCDHGTCKFDIAKIYGNQAKVDSHGNAPVPINFNGPATGTVALESGGSGGLADIASAKQPVILGEAHFKVHKKGKVKIDVHLSSAARKKLKHSRKLQARAVITFKQHGKSTSSSVPLTLKG